MDYTIPGRSSPAALKKLKKKKKREKPVDEYEYKSSTLARLMK